MRKVSLHASEWGDITTWKATSFKDRLLGLRVNGVDSVLIDRGSVHTFGLTEEIEIVAISSDMTVVETRTVAPNRVVRFRSARSVLELPAGSKVPPPGTILEVIDD